MLRAILRRLFWRQRPGVFRFWDGKAWKDADPLASYYGLFSEKWLGGDPDYHLIRAEEGRQDSMELLIEASRDVFGIKSLADGGLSDLETFAIFRQFVLYTEVVKKNIGMQLVSQPFSDAMPADLSEPIQSDSSPSDSSPVPSEDDKPSECEKERPQPSMDSQETGSNP